MRSPFARCVLAMLLVSAWMGLLFAGHAAGGAVHLLLVAAAAVFPWRALRARDDGGAPTESDPSG